MIPTRRFSTVLLLGTLACNPESGPAASPTAGSATSEPPLPIHASIVGTIVVTATKQPPAAGLVYLEDAPKHPGAAMTATINVDHKNFTPFIAVVTTGGTVTFGNLDALAHHVFSPDIKDFDTGFLKKGETSARTFDTAGPVSLLCNIHPEMVGYLMVIPSTYYSRMNADGTYAIPDVPPGTYKATAWVPRVPPVTQSVTIGESNVTLNFEMRRPE